MFVSPNKWLLQLHIFLSLLGFSLVKRIKLIIKIIEHIGGEKCGRTIRANICKFTRDLLSHPHLSLPRKSMAGCQSRDQQSKNKKWLCTSLIFDIIFHWVFEEVFELEKDLRGN